MSRSFVLRYSAHLVAVTLCLFGIRDAKSETLCNNSYVMRLAGDLMKAFRGAGFVTKNIEIILIKADAVNAFAAPDNKLRITSKLIQQFNTIDELAAVIGHEVGHIELNHFRKSEFEKGVDVFLSNGASSLIGQYGSAQFSQAKEQEADAFAVKALAAVGIHPRVVGETLKKIAYGPPNILVTFFGSHPDAQTRKEAADKVAKGLVVQTPNEPLPPLDRSKIICN